MNRRDFLQGALAGGAVTATVAGAGGFIVRQPSTVAPSENSDLAGVYSYIIFRSGPSGDFVAKNGSTGKDDYTGEAAAVLTSVNSALKANGGTAYLKGPCDFGSITWTLSGKTAVVQDPSVTGLSLASDGTWLGTVLTSPAPKAFYTLTPNGPTDGGDFGPNS